MFEKGNQLWKLRSRHGCERLFKSAQLLKDAAFEYFQHIDDNPWPVSEKTTKTGGSVGQEVTKKEKHLRRPYLIEGMCVYMGVSSVFWRAFKSRLDPVKDADFISVIAEIEEIIYNNQLDGATVGEFNHNIIARKLGLIEKTENININKEVKPMTDEEIKALNDKLKGEY